MGKVSKGVDEGLLSPCLESVSVIWGADLCRRGRIIQDMTEGLGLTSVQA